MLRGGGEGRTRAREAGVGGSDGRGGKRGLSGKFAKRVDGSSLLVEKSLKE